MIHDLNRTLDSMHEDRFTIIKCHNPDTHDSKFEPLCQDIERDANRTNTIILRLALGRSKSTQIQMQI